MFEHYNYSESIHIFLFGAVHKPKNTTLENQFPQTQGVETDSISFKYRTQENISTQTSLKSRVFWMRVPGAWGL